MSLKHVAMGAAIVALLWLLRPKATVTTSESFGLDPTNYPEALQQFGRAIARAEGFYVGGSIPQRANNPGDIKVIGWSGPQINGISVFDSVDQGWAALYSQLSKILTGASQRYNLDMTIAEMGRIWSGEANDNWSNNVAAELGVSSDSPLWTVLV